MRKFLKIIGVLALVLVLLVVGAITYVTQALPDIDAPADLKVEVTPERVARGEYLANNVCVCMDCHSTRDWNKLSGPLKPGTLGRGGERFDETMNFPGTLYSKNITPFGIKDWSDGEIYRAITSGVSRDGHAFFPVMPYPNYNQLATEDVYSIIAYLRSLPAIETEAYPASAINFPVNIIMHTIPEAAHPMERPAPNDPKYGEYMVNAAACRECHTRTEKGKKIGESFAGGFSFTFPGGAVVRSANITPHPTDGIGAWDKATFIARFKMYTDSAYVPPPVDWAKGDFQTVMPWMMYATMSEQDLGAIYDYLHALAPVPGRIVKWTPPGG